MDKIGNLVNTHSNKIQYILLGAAGIAAINTLGRADYNFILYLYMFYVWKFMENTKESQAQEKLASFYIMLYSLLIDFVWCFYWGAKWGSLKNDPENFVHMLVLILSWLGVILKIVSLFMIGILEWSSIKGSLPKNLQQKLGSNYSQFDDSKIPNNV